MKGLEPSTFCMARRWQLADWLWNGDLPVSTVREWGRRGTLPRVKLGRHVRYIRSHVEATILHAEEASSLLDLDR
jgi:hypothetical protein